MGICKDIAESSKFCDAVFSEPSGRKKKIRCGTAREPTEGSMKRSALMSGTRRLWIKSTGSSRYFLIHALMTGKDQTSSITPSSLSEAGALRDGEFSPGYLGG